MAIAAPIFVWTIIFWITSVLLIAVLAVEVFAFVNCLMQRADAFPVVGNIPKGGWLALNGGAILFTLLLGRISIFFAFIGAAVAAVYLLDVRPALRDAVDGGHGSW
jgi:hypothetical protein